MAKLSKGLRTVDEKVADLKANFEVLMKDATQIKIDLDKEQVFHFYVFMFGNSTNVRNYSKNFIPIFIFIKSHISPFTTFY